MPDAEHWSAFLAATIVLLLIPGPSVMYVVARGMDHGAHAIVPSAVGLALGDLLQVLLTVLGFSALLATSERILVAITYAGAAYLVILGASRVVTAARGARVERAMAARSTVRGSLVLQGFLALNPKTALFFLALFPQWIDPRAGPAWMQMLWFGFAFVALGLATNALYGVLGAGALRMVALHSARVQRLSQYASGAVLVTLGVLAAMSPMPAHAR